MKKILINHIEIEIDMKKVILILIAGLLLSGNAYAECKDNCVNGI